MPILVAALWGGLAAASLLVGYYLSGRGLSKRNIGLVMGIGAGALISAIAYELVPESMLEGGNMALSFLLGAFAFFGADWWIDHRGGADRMDIAGEQVGSGSAIFIGTLLDNIPESIILGMSLALGGSINIAFLAAVFVSNLPEGVAVRSTWKLADRCTITGCGSLVLISPPAQHLVHSDLQSAGSDGRRPRPSLRNELTMLADAMMPGVPVTAASW
jgi:ZIP family zinc transporter